MDRKVARAKLRPKSLIQGDADRAWSNPCEFGCGLASRETLRSMAELLHTALTTMIEPTLEHVMQPEHVFDAMRKCGSGVRWKASVQMFEVNQLRWAATIRNDVLSGRYKSKGFRRFNIVERGKLRRIQSVHISERTAQKLLCNYALKPTVFPRLIYDNGASQEGKGTEFALKRLREHLRWHVARYGKSGAILLMDYHDFFGSIPHRGVVDAMTERINDDRICEYVSDFVDAFDGDCGLGLGSETSQVGAVCYPNKIDKYIKETLQTHCYARYMDDSYIIHPDRRYVEHCRDKIAELAEQMGLHINAEKTTIHNLATDDFVYLKKRVHITDTGKIVMRITRRNYQDEKRRIRYMRDEYDAGRMPIESIRQSYNSWRGYAKKYNNFRTVGKMDRYFYEIMGDILPKGKPCAE